MVYFPNASLSTKLQSLCLLIPVCIYFSKPNFVIAKKGQVLGLMEYISGLANQASQKARVLADDLALWLETCMMLASSYLFWLWFQPLGPREDLLSRCNDKELEKGFSCLTAVRILILGRLLISLLSFPVSPFPILLFLHNLGQLLNWKYCDLFSKHCFPWREIFFLILIRGLNFVIYLIYVMPST